MKITIKNETLLTATKEPLGILKGHINHYSLVRLKAMEEGLLISCTNGTTDYQAALPADVEATGAACVPLTTIQALLAKLPASADITLGLDTEGDSNTLLVRHSRRKYTLPVSTVDPAIYELKKITPEMDTFMDTTGMIYKALSLVTPYADISRKTNPALGCAVFKADNDKIEVAALNGHQFCLFKEESALAELLTEDLLLDLKNMKPIMPFLASSKELKVAIDKKRIYMRREADGVVSMFSTLRSIEQYPNYTNFMGTVITAEKPTTLVVDRKEMLDALARLAIFNTEEQRNVIFEKSENAGELKMTSPGTSSGVGKEVLEAELNGPVQRISFPNKGLEDILNSFKSDSVTFTFTGTDTPCGTKGNDEVDEAVFTIIMPMLLSEEAHEEDMDTEEYQKAA